MAGQADAQGVGAILGGSAPQPRPAQCPSCCSIPFLFALHPQAVLLPFIWCSQGVGSCVCVGSRDRGGHGDSAPTSGGMREARLPSFLISCQGNLLATTQAGRVHGHSSTGGCHWGYPGSLGAAEGQAKDREPWATWRASVPLILKNSTQHTGPFAVACGPSASAGCSGGPRWSCRVGSSVSCSLQVLVVIGLVSEEMQGEAERL